LFTFYWKETIDTINEAKNFLSADGRIIIGGIASSILPERIIKETNIRPYIGLLDKPGSIYDDDDTIIDELPLDYSLLDEIEYIYPAHNAYFGYTTRGCVNSCSFCSVRRLEPEYRNYISIREQIERTAARFGEQRDLLLLDNNIFASKCFNQIIDDIKALGFAKGAIYNPPNEYAVAINNIRDGYNVRIYIKKVVKFYDNLVSKLTEAEQGVFYNSREKLGLLYADTATTKSVLAFDEVFAPKYNKLVYSKINTVKGRVRYVDLNQGVDARLMTEDKMKKLSEVNIRPLRIAFDYWETDPHKPHNKPMREIYEDAVRLAVKYGIRDLSNYLLYNTDNDKPDELYQRLSLNVELCEKLKVSIYSFPMKYHPIDDPDYFNNRNFIGKLWNRKYIRAVQAVLNSTHGKIGRGKSFFEVAFGKDLTQFHEILLMPEAFIIERYKYDCAAYEIYLNNGGTRKIDTADIKRYGGMTDKWRNKYASLNTHQKDQAKLIIYNNDFTDDVIGDVDGDIREVLMYYRIKR